MVGYPGESRKLIFRLPVDAIAFHNRAPELAVEEGGVRVLLGSSSEDTRLEGRFAIVDATGTVVEKGIVACAADVTRIS